MTLGLSAALETVITRMKYCLSRTARRTLSVAYPGKTACAAAGYFCRPEISSYASRACCMSLAAVASQNNIAELRSSSFIISDSGPANYSPASISMSVRDHRDRLQLSSAT